MLFNSFIFVGLVCVTFFLYYWPTLSKYQVEIVILSSLIFYAYDRPILVLILLFSATINIITSYYVVHGIQRKTSAILGVSLNLGILVFFKYSPLFSNTFLNETSSIGQFLSTIPLPIGISFFTFQGISLVVDVFTEKDAAGREMIPVSFMAHSRRILFYKSFFPQLVSGPIVKAHDFLPQISYKEISTIPWERCFKDIVLGFFLKVVIADNLKDFTFWITYPAFQMKSSITLITMLFGYSCQIFADFAGYSLIAIGIARLFGYNFRDNFDFPYVSTSFREFWTRWNISLSSFLREYLYIPLGGNKRGRFRTYLNIMITMVLGGVWHGAAWSYAIWGTFHGMVLAIERVLSDTFKAGTGKIVGILKGVIVFMLITVAWLFFKLPNIKHVIVYFNTIFTNWGAADDLEIILNILIYSSAVVLYHAAYLFLRSERCQKTKKYEYVAYGFMLFMIAANSGFPAAFIYFQF